MKQATLERSRPTGRPVPEPAPTPEKSGVMDWSSDAPEVKNRRPSPRRLKHLALWSRQLYVLVHSGTPLAESMAAVERQTPAGAWRDVLADLRHQIDEGVGLTDAMKRHPAWFDPLSRSLIAAGESSGQLDAMLDRLSVLTRQQLRVRRSLIGALVYPALLIVVAIAVMTVMICFVFPRFAELFQTLNAPLPPTTKFLMVVSTFFRTYWWAVLISLVAAVVGGHFGLQTTGGRRLTDSVVVRLPFVGKVLRSFATARIARLLGTLVESRVPLLDAIQLTQESASNSLYTDLMGEAAAAVTRGQTISSVFSSNTLITPSVTEAVRHGEANGQIGPILTDMATFMDEENETIVRTLTSILEPVILIFLGAFVAFVALSMFLPLFDLTSMT